ncbi:MAG: D-glycero-beta-D-manno-heptose 1-phosphate adenylyltransferase [Calditrichaeota bacterium]|nr:MAG: D-glycero-beta-D-manno-heptose 1-phosphate adenylyltransferase [Calditrichota bacterium]
MLDHYVFGDCERISPEAPIPVFKEKFESFTLGGAGNLALNLKACGVEVSVLGVLGTGKNGKRVKQILEEKGILADFLQEQKYFPTTTKRRFIAQGQQLFRADFEQTERLNLELPQKDELKNFDFFIVSDYAKGVVSKELVQEILKVGKPVYVAPKSKDFSTYQNSTLVLANQTEISEATNEKFTLENASKILEKIQSQNEISNVVVTLAEKGVCFLENEKVVSEETKAKEIFDVTGAGDTFLAVLAPIHFLTKDLHFACKIANLAAGQVVSKQGTSVVNFEEIIQEKTKTLTLKEALEIRNSLQKENKIFVFTNGCFDVLHNGHIQLLRKAKSLGDYLFVAVNSDSSVKKLKGNSRPIFELSERLEMLSALEFVDGIFAFSEETPLKIIEKLKPDFLVKGGDYKLEEIVGKEVVGANGGKVVVFEFESQQSTSKILDKLN